MIQDNSNLAKQIQDLLNENRKLRMELKKATIYLEAIRDYCDEQVKELRNEK